MCCIEWWTVKEPPRTLSCSNSSRSSLRNNAFSSWFTRWLKSAGTNAWTNLAQSWTPGQKCAWSTVWSASSTPASSSSTDWSRPRGVEAHSHQIACWTSRCFTVYPRGLGRHTQAHRHWSRLSVLPVCVVLFQISDNLERYNNVLLYKCLRFAPWHVSMLPTLKFWTISLQRELGLHCMILWVSCISKAGCIQGIMSHHHWCHEPRLLSATVAR